MKEDNAAHYSRWVGSIYIFNLIVGTGALAMPKAFQDAGWLLSGVVLAVLCFLSYVTTTFVIESMSISNGLRKLKKLKYTFEVDDFTQNEIDDDVIKTMHTMKKDEREVVDHNYGTIQDAKSQMTESLQNILPKEEKNSSFFEITETFEMGEMAIAYFNKVGLVFFYLSMCIYLYGDLAVYAAAVPTSLRNIACTFQFSQSGNNSSFIDLNLTLSDSDPCWPNSTVTRLNAYRIFLTVFVVLLCPFVFFNLSKTKFLQITTLSMRWLAFGIMFVLMAMYLGQGNRYGNPGAINLARSPNLFGICIYAFMCHHSLPSLITPINNKRRLYTLLLANFIIILGFYFCLNYLSIFTFYQIKDLITLNFEPAPDYHQPNVTNIAFFQYYLMLFPVFSLSTSFPIIGITLRNNLKNLITCGSGRSFDNFVMDRLMYPLIAIIPPIIVVYSTDNIQMLVGFTGSYAGSVIQYIVPISLAICARKQLKSFLSKMDDNSIDALGIDPEQLDQIYQSPFRHLVWSIIIIIWTVISIIFVTVNHII